MIYILKISFFLYSHRACFIEVLFFDIFKLFSSYVSCTLFVRFSQSYGSQYLFLLYKYLDQQFCYHSNTTLGFFRLTIRVTVRTLTIVKFTTKTTFFRTGAVSVYITKNTLIVYYSFNLFYENLSRYFSW